MCILSICTSINFSFVIVRQERPPSPDLAPAPSSASGSAAPLAPVLEKSTIEEERELPMEIPEAFRFTTNGKSLPRPKIRHMAFAK